MTADIFRKALYSINELKKLIFLYFNTFRVKRKVLVSSIGGNGLTLAIRN